jgi:hypothetical protein
MGSVRFVILTLIGGLLGCIEGDDERLPSDDDVMAEFEDAEAPVIGEVDASIPQAPEDAGQANEASVPVDGAVQVKDAGRPDASEAGSRVPMREDASVDKDAADILKDASMERDAERRPPRPDAGVVRRDASVADAGLPCTGDGNLRYTLMRAAEATPEQSAAYQRIMRAMDGAIEKYNCYTDIERMLVVSFDPAEPSASARANGTIRFGSQGSMNVITAVHEISHALGVGSTEFRAMVMNGVFTGMAATNKLRDITKDPMARLLSDGEHFWPYGLQEVSEYRSEVDALNHCQLVEAIRTDLRL